MKLIIMGSGTSFGVPVIGCHCPVCTSKDFRDRRYRASCYITNRDEKESENFVPLDIVIDTGPEFRLQALENNIERLDAVFITHPHADHLHGLDDLRRFSCIKPKMSGLKSDPPLPVYANKKTVSDIKIKFDYVFTEVKEGGGKPNLLLNDVSKYSEQNPLVIKNLMCVPLLLRHGLMSDCGWLLSHISKDNKKHSVAYLTDCNFIPMQTLKIIEENAGILDTVVIDALREQSHSTHFSFFKALSMANILGAKNTFFTHMTHDKSHIQVQQYIDEHLCEFENLSLIVKSGGRVEPSYDGLEIEMF